MSDAPHMPHDPEALEDATGDDDLKAENRRLRAMIFAWQEWWQVVGWQLYKKLDHSYRKPPFLREDSEFYRQWLTEEEMIEEEAQT